MELRHKKSPAEAPEAAWLRSNMWLLCRLCHLFGFYPEARREIPAWAGHYKAKTEFDLDYLYEAQRIIDMAGAAYTQDPAYYYSIPLFIEDLMRELAQIETAYQALWCAQVHLREFARDFDIMREGRVIKSVPMTRDKNRARSVIKLKKGGAKKELVTQDALCQN